MSSLTAALRAAGRTPAAEMTLPLTAGTSLVIRQWLRILPGKRLVGRGEWQGRPVLAKLFIAAGAERHWQREQQGLEALLRAGIATPALLDSGELAGGGRYLLTEYLADTHTLQQSWEALPDPSPHHADALVILQQALTVIAAMHSRGLAQTDMHLGNFLQGAQQLYVIDGDAIETSAAGTPLELPVVLNNLGLFFAQLTPPWDAQVESLLAFYLNLNPVAGLDKTQLLASVAAQRQQRLDNFLGKTLRDCSQFAVEKQWHRFCAVLRTEEEALAPLLADPDSAFGGQSLLKDGGSSTVTVTQVAGRTLVVKRYNIKSFSHWLSRFWRPSRAWHSWLAAWRLQFLGIATPKPLAMIERRIGPWRRQAWLISEYCPGPDLLRQLGESGEVVPDQSTATALLHTFNQLAAARISHGDFKATNLLWQDGQVVLIDLDAMQAHGDASTWNRAWAKDRARFIRNWPADSALARWLASVMPR